MPISYSETPTLPPSQPSNQVQVGERVGALREANDKQAFLFGYGVYHGLHTDSDLRAPNPKIVLDSGEVVWGYQCWWGREARIKAICSIREVVIVPVPKDH